MRLEFELCQLDREFLECFARPWEALMVEKARWLLIHQYPIPSGYNVTEAIAAFLLEQNYPTTQIDMVYFYPALSRKDGRSINNLSSQSLDGKEFQRWSRHRTPQNPWRPDEDYLGTHATLVDDWLRREFGR